MCGIAGYSLSDNEKHLIDMNNCIKCLKHRGPDSSSMYRNYSRKVGLVHTRLSIIDTSNNGDQPIGVKKYKAAMVFNGEIYNFKNLKKYLSKIYKKDNFENDWISESDTEVLQRFYLDSIRSGISISKTLNKLNGIFSFALYDIETEELHLVRDALGVKPLYYFSNEENFLFSSEIKSLIKINPDIFKLKKDFSNYDYDSINRYLTYLWNPGNGTPTKLIKKLGPGEYMRIKYGKILEHKRWYKLPLKKNIINDDSAKEIKSMLRIKISEAVRRQLIADVPVGAFLSGGLDSSCIVNFAKKYNNQIETFTIKVDDNKENLDYKYAKEVAKHLNVKLNVVEVKSADFIENIENFVYQLDEPLADPAAINVKFISSLAKKKGIKVLLSGTGGDDIFTGYRRHAAINYHNIFNYIPKYYLKKLEGFSNLLPTQVEIFRRFNKFFNSIYLSGNERLVSYFEWNSSIQLNQIYSDEFKKKLSRNQSNKIMLDFLNDFPEGINEINKMLSLEQRFFLADHNLIYNDKMSMENSIEVRVPFLDLDLIKYVSKIPYKYKQKGLCGKWILKKVMEPYLPKKIIYRKKIGFGLPIRSWLRNELKDWTLSILNKQTINERGLFNADKVHELIKMNNLGKIDGSYLILSLICMELWFKKFYDQI